MDYLARKIKKKQAERHATEGKQKQVLDEADTKFLNRVVSADEPPPLPARPQFGPTAGDFEDNILQLVLYDSATAEANLEDQSDQGEDQEKKKSKENKDKGRDKKKDKEHLKLTAEENAELERLVDQVKESTRSTRSSSRSRGKERAREKKEKKSEVEKKDEQDEAEDKENREDKRHGRLSSMLGRSGTKKGKGKNEPEATGPVDEDEAAKEAEELNKVLDGLDLSSVNTRAFSFSRESQNLLQEFTLILKDLMNGVPTAYDDLNKLLNDKDGALQKSYDHLPSFLQKLIVALPKKIGNKVAPELTTAATKAQTAYKSESGASSGLMGVAQSFLTIATVKELATNPAGIKTMLKSVMTALKLRWPVFISSNILLSLGVFVLLFVFWYCHKRGREVRLEKEKQLLLDADGNIIEGSAETLQPENAEAAEGEGVAREAAPSGSKKSPSKGRETSSRSTSKSRRSQSSDERLRNPEIEEAEDDTSSRRQRAKTPMLLEYRSLGSESQNGESSTHGQSNKDKDKDWDGGAGKDRRNDRDKDPDRKEKKQKKKKKRRSSN